MADSRIRRTYIGNIMYNNEDDNASAFCSNSHDSLSWKNLVVPSLMTPITLYTMPPFHGDCALSDLELLSLQRLTVLQYLDPEHDSYALGAPDNPNHDPSKYMALISVLEKNGLAWKRTQISGQTQSKWEEFVRLDAISHYILRLAFSQHRNKYDWFIDRECQLLKIKLLHLKAYERLGGFKEDCYTFDTAFEAFLHRLGIKYDCINENTQNSDDRKLLQLASNFRDSKMRRVKKIYKIPFYPDAISLVRSKRVLIQNQYAYVPLEDMDTIIVETFRRLLRQSLEKAFSRQNVFEYSIACDPRIASFVKTLPEYNLGNTLQDPEKFDPDDRLSPAKVHEVATRSFPPCMRRLYTMLLKEHHLKHWGRQQLWLFFKGCGMKLEESLEFNRARWSDPSQFDKEHRYNIRHIYGQEGKKAQYSAYNCSKIMGGMLPIPSRDDHHGCPFKQFDKVPLQKLLNEYGLSSQSIKPIMAYKDSGQFQLACVQYFMETHPGSSGDGVGNHPNAFYRESQEYYRKKLGASNPQVSLNRTKMVTKLE